MVCCNKVLLRYKCAALGRAQLFGTIQCGIFFLYYDCHDQPLISTTTKMQIFFPLIAKERFQDTEACEFVAGHRAILLKCFKCCLALIERYEEELISFAKNKNGT